MKIAGFGSGDHGIWADIIILGPQLTVDEHMARWLLSSFPTLSLHACKNSGAKTTKNSSVGSSTAKTGGTEKDSLAENDNKDYLAESDNKDNSAENDNNNNAVRCGTFGDCLPGALLPHAAEHLAIELLVCSFPGEVFAGNTTWLSRREQSMRVRISLPKTGSHQAANDALSDAIEHLNGLLAMRQRQMG